MNTQCELLQPYDEGDFFIRKSLSQRYWLNLIDGRLQVFSLFALLEELTKEG